MGPVAFLLPFSIILKLIFDHNGRWNAAATAVPSSHNLLPNDLYLWQLKYNMTNLKNQSMIAGVGWSPAEVSARCKFWHKLLVTIPAALGEFHIEFLFQFSVPTSFSTGLS